MTVKATGILVSVTLAIAPCAALADGPPCLPENAVYAHDWQNDTDTPATRTVYKVHPEPKDMPRRFTNDITFETWRNDKLVWSLDGEFSCGHIVPGCNLTLDRIKKPSTDEVAKFCDAFVIYGEQIHEGEEVGYIAFGGLLTYSIMCGDGLDVRVKTKDQFSAIEQKEKAYVLPSYVRFEVCND